MSKSFVIFVFFTFVLVVSSPAAIYKGQRVFKRVCVECHTTRQTFIKEKTISEWEELVAENGKALAEKHLKDIRAKDSWKYFMSKKYTKKLKHLRQFLVEYAKDSGKIPACN